MASTIPELASIPISRYELGVLVSEQSRLLMTVAYFDVPEMRRLSDRIATLVSADAAFDPR